MGKIKNMLISQQEEEEMLLEEEREKRWEYLQELAEDDEEVEDFNFEKDQGARP